MPVPHLLSTVRPLRFNNVFNDITENIGCSHQVRQHLQKETELTFKFHCPQMLSEILTVSNVFCFYFRSQHCIFLIFKWIIWIDSHYDHDYIPLLYLISVRTSYSSSSFFMSIVPAPMINLSTPVPLSCPFSGHHFFFNRWHLYLCGEVSLPFYLNPSVPIIPPHLRNLKHSWPLTVSVLKGTLCLSPLLRDLLS